MLPWVILTVVALMALLLAEYRRQLLGIAIAKPLAATGYIAVALSAGALDSPYGICVLAGLALSWFGDVFLIPEDSPRIFQAGVLAFLLGHVAYAVGFGVRGVAPLASLGVAVAILPVAALVLRWLRPHVPDDMRVSVHAYIVVITLMLVLAAGTTAAHGGAMIVGGALLFYLSDLAVARDRFVSSGFGNRAWGLPFYFVGQLLLAASVAEGAA
ncbi:MAG: lysoplasmalogenase [Deltaproteobacteria bacterium]|nr:lysoplasmalogenase [Deltaproteobacteria bacterium]MBW2417907.1 lysoplasmalogenase [Deltaproteobacteria bacterium]